MTVPPDTKSADYHRVERALARLERARGRRIAVDDLARAAGTSPAHFRRLFTRWAGLGPGRFVQALSVAHARALLRDSRPVLDAAFESGLSGPGRLHDLMVSVEAMTPGEYRRLGEGLEIHTAVLPTRFGAALAASTARGLCALEFPGSDADDAESDEPERLEAALARLRAHWPGARFRPAGPDTPWLPELRRALDPGRDVPARSDGLRVLLKGTNFQIQVWRALLRVPEGALIDYGQLAERVGRPGASRAVGSAVGANPVSWVIPCHRVLRRHGELGGYRWGTARKLALLGGELVSTLPE